MITVLIMGIGGTNSIAILKALNQSSLKHRSVGADIKALNAGSLLVDKSYLVPKVSDETEYKKKIKEIIRTESVDIIFATTEAEIAYLGGVKDELEATHEVVVMVPDKRVLDICQDKYKTQEFLKSHSFTYIPTVVTDSLKSINSFVGKQGYPLIRKPIMGYGSRGIDIVSNDEDLERFEVDSDYVLQAYIEGDESDGFDEYTAEIFVNSDGSVAGGIIIQRALIRGESNNGRVIHDDQTLEYLKEISKKLGIKGPCNFQYRMKGSKPYIFEINARYSGTSAVRAHFGFNNVDLALRSFVNNEHVKVNSNDISTGYFVRYWEEAYIGETAFKEFQSNRVLRNE